MRLGAKSLLSVIDQYLLHLEAPSSGDFRLVKLEGLSPSILWYPKGGGVRGGGVGFETGGLTLNWGAKPPLAPS